MPVQDSMVVRPPGEAIEPDDDAARIATAWLLAYTGNTREAYARDLKRFGHWLSERQVAPLEVRRAHVDAYARALEAEGCAPATVARALASLSSFYRYAEAEGAISRGPLALTRRPKVESAPALGLSGDEVSRLLAAAEDHHREHLLICLLALNGLRVSEALGIDADDHDYERGHRVLAITRKGGRRATVPLAPRTAGALDAYLGDRAEGPLFVTTSGRRMDRHAAWKTVRRLAKQAGIAKPISPHSLRHSFVTLALDSGAALRDVQDAAGHADPRTTRRYDRARFSLDRHPTYAVAAQAG